MRRRACSVRRISELPPANSLLQKWLRVQIAASSVLMASRPLRASLRFDLFAHFCNRLLTASHLSLQDQKKDHTHPNLAFSRRCTGSSLDMRRMYVVLDKTITILLIYDGGHIQSVAD
jgi:hypothetical protein